MINLTVESILNKLQIQLRKEGLSYSDIDPIIDAKRVALNKSQKEFYERKGVYDDYDPAFEKLKARQPNLLQRKFNIDRSSKKKY